MLFVLQSSFFAHFMCFEVPAFVPPGAPANGMKNEPDDNDLNDDDISFIDSDGNDIKQSTFLTNQINLVAFFIKYKISNFVWQYLCLKMVSYISSLLRQRFN